MNKARKSKIRAIIEMIRKAIACKEYSQDTIDTIISLIDQVKDEEEHSYDNIPENLQFSTRGEQSYDAIMSLGDAMYCIEDFDDEYSNEYKEKMLLSAIDSLNEI